MQPVSALRFRADWTAGKRYLSNTGCVKKVIRDLRPDITRNQPIVGPSPVKFLTRNEVFFVYDCQ